MTSPSGIPTNALYGTFSMLLNLLEKGQPDYIAGCFDSRAPSFRRRLFPAYKANRGEMPEDLQEQAPFLKKMVHLLGIYSLEREGFEADDLIGTMTAFGRKRKLRVVIVSGDKDFAQLVSEEVLLFDTMKSKTYNTDGVKKKWGVSPSQMVDLLALAGDTSDNIPGVRGIGPKGAVRLLEQYGGLESIYENIDNIKGSLKKKLEEGKELCFLSRELVTIKKDLPVSCNLENLALDFSKRGKLKELLKELGFASFLQNLYPEQPLEKQSVSKKANLQEVKKKKNMLESHAKQADFFEATKESSPSSAKSLIRSISSLSPYGPLWMWVEGGKVLYGAKSKGGGSYRRK